ncbi:MAG TPA: hypothetical protein VNF05_04125 [Acidimicrobiales bacterium]|nr:hypothetical protein [Acidimicrobiales bacterium]
MTIDVPASDDELLIEARKAFHSWVALLAEQLEAAGVDQERARGIAVIAVAGVEGALILCRVERGSAPLDAVANQLGFLFESRI